MTTLVQLLKSRTVWFALLLAVLSVVQGYVGDPTCAHLNFQTLTTPLWSSS